MSSEENGFLTDVDKQFLRGEKEYESNQGRYDRRRAIAERARQAFHDFALLYDTLDEHERDRIFDVGVEDGQGDRVVVDREAVETFRESIVDTIAFLYLALEGELDDPPPYRSMGASFEEILEAGVSEAEIERRPGSWHNYVTDTDLSVSVTSAGDQFPERAIEKIAEYRAYELSERELRALVIAADPETTGEGVYDYDWSTVGELIQTERQGDDGDDE